MKINNANHVLDFKMLLLAPLGLPGPNPLIRIYI